MPSDLLFKVANTVHRLAVKLSGGRLGWTGANMPVLELTTIGRKSGQPRSVMLTSPLQEGSTIVVVASRGGDDKHPAWLLNLRENPQVDVVFQGRRKQRMRARLATSEERTRLWSLVTADHPHYAGYQRRTEREIPLVLLEPEP
jgi:deazaflavin-dependent oxidoreductase (nitroreductase family)